MSKKGFEQAAATGNALLVRVKRNQPSLYDALATLCDAQCAIDRHASVDRHRHGRQEHRLTEVFKVDDRLGPEWQPLIACAARISRLTSILFRQGTQPQYIECSTRYQYTILRIDALK